MEFRVVVSGEELESAKCGLIIWVLLFAYQLPASRKEGSINVFAWAMLLGINMTACPRSEASLFWCGAIWDEMDGHLSYIVALYREV